jgi:isopentenyl diphosphate isomerase/L-lactate dehydrogenase-like FMN-dependent dehydrogenase
MPSQGASETFVPQEIDTRRTTRVLQIIQKELDVTMAFCGRRDINEVGTDILLPRSAGF